MAVVSVAEYNVLTTMPYTSMQMAKAPPVAAYDVAITAGSVLSQAFVGNFIRINTDSACRIAVGGSAPVAAVGTAPRFSADSTEYFMVIPGDKLAVITSA